MADQRDIAAPPAPSGASGSGSNDNESLSPSLNPLLNNTRYSGIVKWFNESRGFGFVECDGGNGEFGRDVFLSRIEKEGEGLTQGDYVSFQVRMSPEGHPQSSDCKKLQRFKGRITQLEDKNAENSHDGMVQIASDMVKNIMKDKKIVLDRKDCVHLILHVDDNVEFCLDRDPNHDDILHAKFLCMMPNANLPDRLSGHFTLEILDGMGGVPKDLKEPLVLDCHAFGKRLTLGGLQLNMTQEDLLDFFEKYGSIHARVQRQGFGFVVFNTEELLLDLINGKHREETGSIRFRLLPPREENCPRLPSMLPPNPLVVPDVTWISSKIRKTLKNEDLILGVQWHPVDMATCYTVQIRALDNQEWQYVDAITGTIKPKAVNSARFPSNANQCAVTGLRPVEYQFRIFYYVKTDCFSIASDPSEVLIKPTSFGKVPTDVETDRISMVLENVTTVPKPEVGVIDADPNTSAGTVVVRWKNVKGAKDFFLELREAGNQKTREVSTWKANDSSADTGSNQT